MEGRDSKLFIYFKVLIYQCFVVIRKHIDYVCNAIEIMMEGSSMKCFSNFDLKGFRDRFNFSLNDNEVGRRGNFRERPLLMNSYMIAMPIREP